MPDPDKWIKQYVAECQEVAANDPEKKKRVKKHLHNLEELWNLLPSSHKKTVMRIKTGNL